MVLSSNQQREKKFVAKRHENSQDISIICVTHVFDASLKKRSRRGHQFSN